jgi:hypothetical protein
LTHATNFSFSTTTSILFTMDGHKPSQKKPAKTSLPSAIEKEEMTASLNAKLPKLVQPTPLEPPPKFFAPPVEDSGTSAPLFDASSNAAALFLAVYPNDGYNYEGRYGGHQPTRFNSSQVDDREHNARAEYRYQQATHRPTPAPGYVDPYSASYSDSYAYGQGHRASYEAP